MLCRHSKIGGDALELITDTIELLQFSPTSSFLLHSRGDDGADQQRVMIASTSSAFFP